MAPSSPNPRYARATASSSLKCSPKSSKSCGRRQTLHRPSPSSSSVAGLLTIEPANREEPCLLATLPTELRLLIYGYALPPWLVYLDQKRAKHLRLPLLGVCKLIRLEAADVYYTRNPFMVSICSLQPNSPTCWTRKLPPAHLALLTRNRNMMLTIPSSDASIPRSSASQWHYAEPFGILYGIHGQTHRLHFLRFCRLAKWWLSCSEHSIKNMKWNYTFQEPQPRGWWYRLPTREDELRTWLFNDMTSITLPCVQEAWIRNRREKEMKGPALQMLDGLNQAFEELEKPEKRWGISAEKWMAIEAEASRRKEEWDKRMGLLKRFIEKW
ncbi:hypothetical protein P280DRAFT_545543 [Massarina eburnea CBS 473.64]|uniref:F-box domain-containing protein n=1 Tax=Massarina eburnea CBS 473.64 TaxID=1395130 RepID=A0A6A6SFD4_9PLEO|nr:hypothetical protein P280DRAFT_545543 [Massarina eburnea CBS 473.64]